eukprot:2112483-Rhodomonas_salina.1
MEEVLDQLVEKQRLDCEEANRLLVAAENGLAGICLLNDDHKGAVCRYKEVLDLAERGLKEGR